MVDLSLLWGLSPLATPFAASSYPWSAVPSLHRGLGSSRTNMKGPIDLKSLKAKVIKTEKTCRVSSYPSEEW